MWPGIASMGIGLIGSMFSSSPEWKNVQFHGVNANDPNLKYKPTTDFGQGVASDNMQRYGFQGVYQNFLKSETDRMKNDEQRRISKLASGLVQGEASTRGGLASQGLNAATSNVIAHQQREQGLTKAGDIASNLFNENVASLDKGLFAATQVNEQMRFGASKDLMSSTGMASEATNTAGRFNASQYGDISKFNSQGQLQADIANSQGQFSSDSFSANKWNSMFGNFMSAGAGMIGNEIGMNKYKELFGGGAGKKNPWEMNMGDVPHWY